MDNEKQLIKKVVELESQLQEKEKILKEYQEALIYSNARIEKINSDLKKGLETIRSIHKSLVPTDLPSIPHFDFSYKFIPTKTGVSGDFFDVIKLNDPFKFGILLSTSKTYAVTALFFSSVLRSSSKLKECKTSHEAITSLLNELSSHIPEEDSLHIFYGIVNRRNLIFDYTQLGSVFPVFKSFDESDPLVLESPKNFDTKKLFSGKELQLRPKDILTICSSGILEQKNKTGELFGKQPILNILQKKYSGILDMRQDIIFQMLEFGKDIPADKDQTLLIMKVKENIVRLQT